MDLGIPPPPSPPPATPAPSRNPFRRLYHWLLGWAHHPAGTWALAAFAFIDSSIFPVPPLFLQVAMSLEKPKRSWWYATVDLVGSILGAIVGYLIGAFLFEEVGRFFVSRAHVEYYGEVLRRHGFWITFVYSFLPFPYKIMTIGTGFLGGSPIMLLAASSLGRALRFYALAAICFWKGPEARVFIERKFNWVLLGVGALVVAVLIILKFWLG